MIIDDLDVLGAQFGPPQTDTVLVVDSDRVLTRSVAFQLLEAQTREGEGLERYRSMDLVECAPGAVVEVRR